MADKCRRDWTFREDLTKDTYITSPQHAPAKHRRHNRCAHRRRQAAAAAEAEAAAVEARARARAQKEREKLAQALATFQAQKEQERRVREAEEEARLASAAHVEQQRRRREERARLDQLHREQVVLRAQVHMYEKKKDAGGRAGRPPAWREWPAELDVLRERRKRRL